MDEPTISFSLAAAPAHAGGLDLIWRLEGGVSSDRAVLKGGKVLVWPPFWGDGDQFPDKFTVHTCVLPCACGMCVLPVVCSTKSILCSNTKAASGDVYRRPVAEGAVREEEERAFNQREEPALVNI